MWPVTTVKEFQRPLLINPRPPPAGGAAMIEGRPVQLNCCLSWDVIKGLREKGFLADDDIYQKDRIWLAAAFNALSSLVGLNADFGRE
jgi:hypothetical protein